MFVALEVIVTGFFIGSTIFFIKNYIKNEIERTKQLGELYDLIDRTRISIRSVEQTMERLLTINKPEVVQIDKLILKGRGIANPFKPGEIKKLYSMLDMGRSPKEIAKRLNRSLSSIFLYKRKWKSKQDTSN